MNSRTVRILAPGLALGAAILAGAILAAERPAEIAGAPELVRVRLVSAMAKWRGCLLRVADARRAESLGAAPDHVPALAWTAAASALAASLLFPGFLPAPARAGRRAPVRVHRGRAPPRPL